MEPGKALVGERKAGVIVVHRRIEQDLRMRLQMREGGVVIQFVVEHLHHNVRAREVREPIAKNVLRQEPPPEPTALKVESQRLSKGRLCEGAHFVAQAVIDGGKRSAGHAGDHIDLLEQLALLQLEHDGGPEVRRTASSSGNAEREKATVLPFEFRQVPWTGGFRHRLLAGPLLVPAGPPVTGQHRTAADGHEERGDAESGSRPPDETSDDRTEGVQAAAAGWRWRHEDLFSARL